MTSESLKHIVFVGGANWSHLRHGIKFSTRLVERFPNAFISIFLFAGLAPQASKYLFIQSPSARARTRIALSTLPDQMTSPLDLLFSVKSSFPSWMDEQLRSGGFEVEGIAVAPPSLIIEDHIMGGISLVWQEGNKEQDIPIVSFWVAPAASFIAHIGNAEHGQGGRLLNAIQAALEKQEPGNEKSTEEILRQELDNRVVYVPGLPPHYEHEQVPGIFAPMLPIVSILQARWEKMGKQMHTLILGSTYEMEPIAAEACKIAFTNPVTPFCVGPSFDLPSSSPPSQDPSDPVFAFLNSAEPHSVIYIGFGTLFFPLPESQPHLEIIIEEILQQGFKLILTLSSEQAKLSEDFLESIEKRWKGMAMFPKWVDQLGVLEHPAIHYFLSHGGWNSTTEAIVRGVPMIFWPFAGDQPTNVLQIAHQHGCGFELLQVRSGVARSTAYPNIPIIGTNEAVRDEIKGVLEMSKGGRGAHQRANVRALGKIMVESVGKGGSGDMAMSKFGESFGL